MSCSCSSSPLRLFIRNVARIEVESANVARRQLHITSKHRPTLGLQQVSSRRIIRSTSNGIGKRELQTTVSNHWIKKVPKDYQDDDDACTSFTPSNEAEQESYLAGEDSAIAEFNIDAIDALAAESRQESKRARRLKQEQEERWSTEAISKRSEWDNTAWRQVSLGRRDTTPARTKEEVVRKAAALKVQAKDRPNMKDREYWQIQKAALKAKFGDEPWNPRKRLSPDALAGIRAIHAQFPEEYTTEVLAEKFEVSPEMIRRILKSKWRPNTEQEIDRQERWFKRGEKVWSRYSELGMKPPKKWRQAGVGKRNAAQDAAMDNHETIANSELENMDPKQSSHKGVWTTERRSSTTAPSSAPTFV